MSAFRKKAALLAVTPLIMLGLALSVQVLWGWEPCTMCVEIRVLLMAASLAGFAGLLLPGRLALVGAVPAALLSAGAVYLNAKLVLLEQGVLEAFSCSPFPFYSSAFPLQDWLPVAFMSSGVCGQNDHLVLGVSFTIWTLIGVGLLALANAGLALRTWRH